VKATPAPWTARKIENPDSEDFAIWAGDRVIARTLSVRADAEANARLMALAPEMLAACRTAAIIYLQHHTVR
jgi:hypothetical protein